MLFRKSNKPKKIKAPKAPAAAKAKPTQAAQAYRKPQADLYTMLLVLSLLAVIGGIVFVCLEMNVYNFEFKGGPSVMRTADPQAAHGTAYALVDARPRIGVADAHPCA